jgi:NADH-quinone oxidoreductase subunit C
MDIEAKIKDLLNSKIAGSDHDRSQLILRVSHEEIVEALKSLKGSEELAFDMLTDLCGVDNLPQSPRFEVVYNLLSTKNHFRLRLKVAVPEDTLTVPSITGVFKSANWLEREAYDMYGIKFSAHPDLRRILMHEDFLDYPQRKDFPLKGWREQAD